MKVATLAIITQEGKVLLGLKKQGEVGKGNLNGPGGKLEPGESIEECVVRETREEVGILLDINQVEKMAVVTFYAGGLPGFEVHVFRTSTFSGEPVETEEMIPEWHDITNLPFDKMHDADRAWMEKAIRGEKFKANVYYREVGSGFERIEFLPFL